MPDSLFYLVLVGAAGLYLYSVLRRRRAALAGLPGAARGVRHGPVPGYAYMPGEVLRFDPKEPLQSGQGEWEPVSLETLHAGARSRLVLSVRVQGAPESAELFTLLKTLALRVQRRTQAHVVAVRAEQADGEASSQLVYAPDGLGWTGTATDAAITAELAGREPFRQVA
jgi:hypothetical protein